MSQYVGEGFELMVEGARAVSARGCVLSKVGVDLIEMFLLAIVWTLMYVVGRLEVEVATNECGFPSQALSVKSEASMTASASRSMAALESSGEVASST